ncbi:MAG: proton-conducting transporter membrane subunit [Bacillota bacterium]|nr:proton-conducting transporter membrane subunit [Bacillota bacterium]
MVYLLVLVPVLFGLVFLFTKEKVYKPLSYLLTVVCIALSVVVLVYGPQSFQISGSTFDIVEGVIVVLEFAMTAFFIFMSVKHKKTPVLLLSIVQAAILIYTVVFGEKEAAAVINIDRLSIVMLLVINVVGNLILIFANGYMDIYEHHRNMKSRQNLFYFIIAEFLGAMNALVICDGLGWVLFFWEVTTLSSFILISYNRDEEGYNSGFRALGLNLIGGIAFGLGNLILSSEVGITTFSQIHDKGTASGIYLVAIFLLCIAGFAKSAQFPFQSWLLGAMVAPTPVSALLHSSTMVKAGVFLIIKLAPAYANTWFGNCIALLGAFCFLLCSAIAISQSNAKRVLAYSTIANLGLIISCAGIGSAIAVSAAIILIIFHAVSKALLFLATGQTEHTIGSRNIDDMIGLIKVAPGLTMIMTFGILSMILPPFGVLITKWLSIEASAANPVIVIFLAFGSAFTNIYYIRWINALLAAPNKSLKLSRSVDRNVYLPLQVLCLLAVLTSLCIAPIYNRLVSPEMDTLLHAKSALTVTGETVFFNAGTFNNTLVFVSLIIIVLVYLLLRGVLSTKAKVTGVYMCGENNSLEEGPDTFRVADGTYVKAEVSNLYLKNLFEEKDLSYVGYLISILMLMGIMIGGLL